LNDQIIPHTVLKLIPDIYIPPNGKPDQDPFLSPLYADEEVK